MGRSQTMVQLTDELVEELDIEAERRGRTLQTRGVTSIASATRRRENSLSALTKRKGEPGDEVGVRSPRSCRRLLS